MSNLKVFKRRLREKNGFISFLFGLILVIIIFLAGLLFQFLTFSTPEEIKGLRGKGSERTYDFPYSQVFQAGINLMEEKGLSIVESNENKGYIIAAEDSEFFLREE